MVSENKLAGNVTEIGAEGCTRSACTIDKSLLIQVHFVCKPYGFKTAVLLLPAQPSCFVLQILKCKGKEI